MIYGKKYNRDMTGAEIGAAIRSDIRAAVAAGELPRAKYSVRLKTYSGGQSISITFADVPFDLYERDFLRHEIETDGRKFWEGERFSAPHRAHIRKLEQLAQVYNFNDSRSEEDYFHVNYYLHVDADWRYDSERRKVETEAVRAELAQRAQEVLDENESGIHRSMRRRQAPPAEIDYDTNLRQQRDIAQWYAQPARAEAFEQQGGHLAQLAYLSQLVVALDDWISLGGALPSRWAAAAATPATRNTRMQAKPIFWPPRARSG